MNLSFDLLRSDLTAMSSVPVGSDIPTISRRGMLKRSGVAVVGVGAALSLPGDSNCVASALPLVARAAFSAAVGWIVEKALDRLAEGYFASQPKITEGRIQPTDGRNPFHDVYATDLIITPYRSVTTSCFSNQLTGCVDQGVFIVPSSLCDKRSGVRSHDLNRVEAILIHKIYEQKCVTEIPLPVSLRMRPTDEDATYISSLLRKERISLCDLVLEYTRTFQSLRGEQLTGFALSDGGAADKRSLVFV